MHHTARSHSACPPRGRQRLAWRLCRASLALLLGFVLGSTPARAGGDWPAALAKYKERIERPSLHKRTQGWRTLAHCDDARAFPYFVRDYVKPHAPVQESRQLIVAAAFHRPWKQPAAVKAITGWRDAHAQAEDTWLWYRSLRMQGELKVVAPAYAVLDGEYPIQIQLAALRALADCGDAKVVERLGAYLSGFEDRASAWKGEQALVLESVARCLASLKAQKDNDTWKAVARAALEFVDDRHVPRRTKFVITRCMAYVLGGDPTDLSKESWVREVMAGGSGAGGDDARYGGPSFGGLRATGDRIVYVIDFSDSMLKPIDPETKKRLSAVITGGPDPRTNRARELPWHKIENRFDLARELLKASLEGLDKDRRFAVVWFGSATGTLDATPKLVKASKKNIRVAIRELDKIKPGDFGTLTQSEHGSLRGETNLHGGMRRAFHLSTKKPLGELAWLSEDARMLGAETIFLLSDGAPTKDDWTARDRSDGEKAVVDRESGVRAPTREFMNFPGPYGSWPADYIGDDMARRNFFRHVEVHCLGLGEARMGLLWDIADTGLGKATSIGKRKTPRKK